MSAQPQKQKPRHLVDRGHGWSSLNRPPAVLDRAEGRVDWGGRKKVAIYAGSYGREQAPWDDPEWVVWCINLVAMLDPDGALRADAWFDLHQRCAQTADDLRWIAACGVPIYVPPDLLDAGPNCVRFPLERVEAAFPPYWACSFGYMIALAMLEGFTDIGLYGVELWAGTVRERTVEWANTSWWMGYAEGRGIQFHLPHGSKMATHGWRYGFEYEAELLGVQEYVDGTLDMVGGQLRRGEKVT